MENINTFTKPTVCWPEKNLNIAGFRPVFLVSQQKYGETCGSARYKSVLTRGQRSRFLCLQAYMAFIILTYWPALVSLSIERDVQAHFGTVRPFIATCSLLDFSRRLFRNLIVFNSVTGSPSAHAGVANVAAALTQGGFRVPLPLYPGSLPTTPTYIGYVPSPTFSPSFSPAQTASPGLLNPGRRRHFFSFDVDEIKAYHT